MAKKLADLRDKSEFVWEPKSGVKLVGVVIGSVRPKGKDVAFDYHIPGTPKGAVHTMEAPADTKVSAPTADDKRASEEYIRTHDSY